MKNFKLLEDKFLGLVNGSYSFTSIELNNKFYTIEDNSDNTDIIIKEFDNEKEYKKLDGEVKDEDTNELYIDVKDFYNSIIDKEGFYITDILGINPKLKTELDDKIYYMMDFFGIENNK